MTRRKKTVNTALILAGVIPVVVLVVLAARDYLEYAHTPKYDLETTKEVSAPKQSCTSLKPPELPEDESLDVIAQIEQDVLDKTLNMTCDPDVAVTCSSRDECAATYRGKEITFDITSFQCRRWIFNEKRCEYEIKPNSFFLTQQRLHAQFWEHATRRREDGALLRCDILPGGVAVLPMTGGKYSYSSPKPTKYHCYAREPGSITITYDVVLPEDYVVDLERET